VNSKHFEHARAAYDNGDYVEALKEYYACLKDDNATFIPGDVGLVYYRLGNCLLKMRSFQEAIAIFEKSLEDLAFIDKSAVRVNLGKSQIGLGDYEGAITSFNAALADTNYQKPYQAHMGLGTAFSRLGMIVDAGIAFRNAALDARNPNPIKALMQLGACFNALGRPQDAIESYKAVFNFDPVGTTRSKTYESLGQAYTATGRYQEAVDAFKSAGAEGRYALSDEALLDYQKAQTGLAASLSAKETKEPTGTFDATEEEQDAAALAKSDASFDSLPLYKDEIEGYGAGNVPAAYDTGFFTATDDELVELGKKQLKKERKLRHVGLKVILAVMIILVLLIGGAVLAYSQGYGYPTQEMIITNLFNAQAEGKDILQYWAEPVKEKVIEQKMHSIAAADYIEISYIESSMTESTAIVTVYLEEGGSVRYEVLLERSAISWKIRDINLIFASQQ